MRASGGHTSNKVALPLFQPIRKIINRRAEDLRVEAFYEEVQLWCPLVPCVKANTEYHMEILRYVARTCLIRSVSIKTGEILMNHGSMANGLTLIVD